MTITEEMTPPGGATPHTTSSTDESTPSEVGSPTGPEHDWWPRLLTVRPRTAVLTAGLIVATAWLLVVLVDVIQVVSMEDRGYEAAMWEHLFNNRPVEWSQWLFLGIAVLTAGFLAGRLRAPSDRGASLFFLIFGAGLVLMIFEDAGDVRHRLFGYFSDSSGLNQPLRVVFDGLYFAAIGVLPLLAVTRFGHHAWRAPTLRPYLVGGVGLYGLAAGASTLRYFNDFYRRLGEAIDNTLFAGRFPAPEATNAELEAGWGHFQLVDGVIEESVELIAAACLLAAILAFAHDFRQRRLTESPARTWAFWGHERASDAPDAESHSKPSGG